MLKAERRRQSRQQLLESQSAASNGTLNSAKSSAQDKGGVRARKMTAFRGGDFRQDISAGGESSSQMTDHGEDSYYSESYSQVSHGAVREALTGLRDQID